MSSQQHPSAVEVNPSAPPIASVIWLHGLGADGNDFAPIVPQLALPELPIRFVFPHAPVQPITANGGFPMRAWYDILAFDGARGEDESGIRASAQTIMDLLQREQELGMPYERIVLAGFSQGGAMALHCGLRFPDRLAGILALSTYLPIATTVAEEASHANKKIPILMAHGTQDQVVPLAWAQGAQQFLQTLDYSIELRSYPMAHSVCMEEIQDVEKWLRQVVVS